MDKWGIIHYTLIHLIATMTAMTPIQGIYQLKYFHLYVIIASI